MFRNSPGLDDVSLDLDSSPIRYHRLCLKNAGLLCFRDETYLCICADNQTRVECFHYDQHLDRCSCCLAGGRCLRGNPSQPNDFFCICLPCHSGKQCQFNPESFVVMINLDQLFWTDLLSDRQQTTISFLMFFSLIAFLLAIPNNLFTFVTLRRRACLRHGVSHYLLWMSVINQINLGFFVLRLVHLIVNTTEVSFISRWNDGLCKSLNYFLSSLGRMVSDD